MTNRNLPVVWFLLAASLCFFNCDHPATEKIPYPEALADAKIEVILAPSDKPVDEGDVSTAEGPTSRYATFFGIESDAFNYTGVKGYFKDILGSQSLENRIESLRKSFASMQKSAEKPQNS